MLDGEATAAAASSASQGVTGAPVELHQPRSLAQVRPPQRSRASSKPPLDFTLGVSRHPTFEKVLGRRKKEKKPGLGNDEMFPETEIIDT